MGARKRMDSVIPAYGAPPLPRSTRPARGRGRSKKAETGDLFDRLAEVAGELLTGKQKMTDKCVEEVTEKFNSDNESATSFDDSEAKKLECLVNQAPHEDKQAANPSEAKPIGESEVAPEVIAGQLEVVVEQSEKLNKVKDEECSSDVVSEDGVPMPAKTGRRSRKRKLSRCTSSGNPSKRAKHVEFQPSAKGANVVKDGHVKVSVNSFAIPELYVDIPESATVGTLKRAVMDAAMKVLGGGLRVCVLLQGRKVPDEAATLSQMGISHDGKPDLGFMLEPTKSSSSTSDDPLLVLLHAANQNTRNPAYVEGGLYNNAAISEQIYYPHQKQAVPNMAVAPPPPHMNTNINNINGNILGGNPSILPKQDTEEQAKNESETSTLSQGTPCRPFDAKAMILHPTVGIGVPGENGMALIPMRPKSHALDISKRRMRRPFSVAEVEALVRAVEQLGTGRWRDVKLQAFENAKHRTYVDLKDKWKTLVHTAQIAPHQRRGDPVPQELLDRVITANNYWTAHQAKEQAELDG